MHSVNDVNNLLSKFAVSRLYKVPGIPVVQACELIVALPDVLLLLVLLGRDSLQYARGLCGNLLLSVRGRALRASGTTTPGRTLQDLLSSARSGGTAGTLNGCHQTNDAVCMSSGSTQQRARSTVIR